MPGMLDLGLEPVGLVSMPESYCYVSLKRSAIKIC